MSYKYQWEKHNGPIPRDEDGKSYEIHHLDGDKKNNNLENLKCVSILEHFQIHFNQEDWGACLIMSKRMNLTQEEVTRLAFKASKLGADKTRGTKWYHRLDGSNLRASPNDPRIINGGWILGRFNGSSIAKAGAEATKRSRSGITLSTETLDKRKQTVEERYTKIYKKEWILESLEQTTNRTQAVYYFNNKFGKICYPTFVKMEKIYYI